MTELWHRPQAFPVVRAYLRDEVLPGAFEGVRTCGEIDRGVSVYAGTQAVHWRYVNSVRI